MDIKEIDIKIRQLRIRLESAKVEEKTMIQNQLNILNLKKEIEIIRQKIRQLEALS